MSREEIPQGYIQIAQIGKTVGLDGSVKLNLHTDFPSQFKKNEKFLVGTDELVVERFDEPRGVIRFVGFKDIDEAKKLVNRPVFTTIEATRAICKLSGNEFFWFDIIGCKIIEKDELLGEITDIERFGGGEFLTVKTDASLVKKGFAPEFVLPYSDRYISRVEIAQKQIEVSNAKDILEAS